MWRLLSHVSELFLHLSLHVGQGNRNRSAESQKSGESSYVDLGLIRNVRLRDESA